MQPSTARVEPALRTAANSQPTEAEGELRSIAHRRTGAVPEELVVAQALAVSEGGDFALQRAALEALLRRVAAIKRDGLVVVERPEGGVLGAYRTAGRGGGDPRPYATLLSALSPLTASCACDDFRRGSLGACKHVLCVVGDLASSARRWRAALAGARPSPRPRLAWDPVRPLTGVGDWLERVSLDLTGLRPGRPPAVLVRALELFDERAPRRLLAAQADDPAARLAVVEALAALAGAAGLLEVDPALVPLLAGEQQRLRERRTLAEHVPALVRGKGLRRRLYAYQRQGVARFLSSGRLLLADDMGLGKTVQAIAAADALWRGRQVRRGLVIVPATLKTQWLREWQACSSAPVRVVDGNREARVAAYAQAERGFLIANYEAVVRDLDLVRRFDPELVILDEAQRIKNFATKTAAAVKRLTPRFRLVLTGTPMENRLDELASILEWIDDMALAPEWRLGPLHTIVTDGKREVAGARNLDTLRSRLAPSMLRRVRTEVLAQLPPRTDTVVPVPLTADQRDAHDDLNSSVARVLGALSRRALSREEFLRLMMLLNRQRMICNGLALADFEEVWPGLVAAGPTEAVLASAHSPKLVELRELLSRIAIEQERKVVVFSQWRRMLELASWVVAPDLRAAGVRSAFFSGQERGERRVQNVVDLHDDPRVRILFATDAGGVGLNLQRAASCVINLDLPWNPAVLEQRIGRVYRLGQTEPVQVYNLVADSGIEARIVDIVGNKRALFAGLFDGDSSEVVFEKAGGFMSRIGSVLRASPEMEEEAEPEVVEPVDEVPAAPVVPRAPVLDGEALARIRVRRTDDGQVEITAPPETAAVLAQVFGALASQLAAASG